VATQLVRGHILVEVLGSAGVLDPEPEPLTLPEPRPIGDYITTPCKHECNVLRQRRYAKQACGVLNAHNPPKQALIRATAVNVA
jgi:hypothetical protein